MKKFILLCAAASCALTSTAQCLSLDQCIDYAIEHNLDVRGRRISAYQSELEVTEAKDRFLPNLSGYASQSFNFGRGLTSDNTYANRNTSSFSLGAQLSLPIFQGLRAIRQLKYSKTALSAAKESTEAAKDNVTLNVITQYLQALYTREMLVVAQQSLDVSRGELARRRELLEAGKIAELDIYEATAQLSSDELRVVNARNDSTIAMLDLAQLLNYPADAPFDIEPLGENELAILSPETVYANALANNHAIRASRLSVDAAEQSVSVARSGYIPTLSFNAGLGSNYYKTSGFNNESFGQQMRHNFSQSLGFSLSVPIFDGFTTRNSVRRAQAQRLSADLELDQARNQLYKSINQAYTQAVAAFKSRDAALVSVRSSEAAFNAMQVKYDNGRANATEYEKTKSDLNSARAQAVQAKYESILRTRILHFYNKQGEE